MYGFLGAVNLFHGRVDGNRLRVGDGMLPHADFEIASGADVVAYARPHELDIVRNGTDGIGIGAKVRRVLTFGLAARVELEGTDSASGQQFEVEITHERAGELDLREGEAVRLVPSRLKVFESSRAESAR